MKRLLTVLLLAAGLQAASQKVKFGITAGPQMNTFTGYKTKYNKYSGSKLGLLAGPTVQFGLSEKMALHSGLLFSTLGGKLGPYTVSIYAVQLPAVLVYKQQRFFIGGGPVLSTGIHGRFQGGDNLNESRNLYEEKSALPLKRIDLQAQATMGYSLSEKIQVSSFYNKSLLNTSNKTNDPDFISNLDSYGLTLNYIF